MNKQPNEINTPISKEVSSMVCTEKGGPMNEMSIKYVVWCPNMAGIMYIRVIYGNLMQWSEKKVVW